MSVMTNLTAEGRALVDVWNAGNVPGGAVTVRRDLGEIQKTTARTSAFIARDGTPVVFLAGISGYYRLDRVRPYARTGGDVECFRASGDFVCRSCEQVLRKHPPDLEHLAAGGVPFLVVGCDGRSYKL